MMKIDRRPGVALIVFFLTLAFALGMAIVVARGQRPTQRQVGGFSSYAKIELGRKLFFDSRLSGDNSTSCATCHDPRRGWTDNQQLAAGTVDRLVGPRNTPTIINASLKSLQFHDGRADSIEDQALQPLTNQIEMANDSNQQVANRLARIPMYRRLFNQVYGGDRITPAMIRDALAQFEDTIQAHDAPVDRYMRGDVNALSPDAQRGFAIFQRSRCMECHLPQFDWRDDRFHNCGASTYFRTGDPGREAISNDVADRRAFSTPTLRDLPRTAPYFHAGSARTIGDVVRFFNRGAIRDDNKHDPRKDPRIAPLGLDAEGERLLTVFLTEAFLSYDYPDVRMPEYE